MAVCSESCCDKRVVAKGLCAMHYARVRAHGTTAAVPRGPSQRRVDLVGQRFGRLVVESMEYRDGEARLHCRCDCGTAAIVAAYNARNGNSKSCGCLALESASATGARTGAINGALNATHGMSGSPTYRKWQDAKNRCFRPQTEHFAHYGGRGISMCQEWADSFDAFLRDMGEAPSGYTLERENVDLDYAPGNCRWATMTEQSRNKTSTVSSWDAVLEIRVRFDAGEPVSSIARDYEMSRANVHAIAHRKTWINPTPPPLAKPACQSLEK